MRTALALAALALLTAAPASAEPGFEYGEVMRFGGFDSSAYNSGQYGGQLTPGEFLDPTGFAVDPVNNTVYVVDRTSRATANPTAWRIQQFSPAGALEGATTFTLPNEAKPHTRANASAIEGLAVDHSTGRLYALVADSPPPTSPYPGETVAQELLAWSTAANAQGELEAAHGLRPDPLQTGGGLISSEEQLLSGSTPLYSPQGIAVDPLGAGGADPVVIEASDIAAGIGKGKPVIGDTIVQQVATQGTALGDQLAHWSGASLIEALGTSWGPHGISAGPDGTLNVLLDSEDAVATNVYVVSLKANLSTATVLDSNATVPPNGDFDQAPLYTDDAPFFSIAGTTVSDLKGSGPQVVQLSGAAPGSAVGPYAAVIVTNRPGDNQVGPTAPEASEYWTDGENAAEDFEANIGVRLLQPEADGSISSPQSRTIVNTLGNAQRFAPCNIGAPRAALAAGADGTLWVLDRGPQADREGASGQGREVIELGPGAARSCPQPSGTFTMTAGKASASGEEKLEVPAGTQVTFSASSVHRLHGKPFAYEWDLDGDPTNGPAGDGFEKVYEMQPPKFYYPPSSITYMYTRPGTYKVRMRMRTDYGVYTPPQPATVIVTRALAQPAASFTALASGAQQVTVNATGSTPGVGTIVNYHWNWGDGSAEDEDPQTPVSTHSYAQAGSYAITLSVTNSSYQSVTSAPQTMTVAGAPTLAPQAALPLAGPLASAPPAALYPIPAAPPDRAPTRLPPHVLFSGGALKVTLACPATKQLCAGTVGVETAAPVAASRSAKGKSSKHKAGRLLLGHATFSIPGGHSKVLNVSLSAQGKALLKSRKQLKVLVLVAAHDSLGDPGATSLTLTLSAAKAHPPAAVRGHRKQGKH